MESVAHPNDNHPPLAIGWGEDYLRRVYEAAVTNPNRWRRPFLIHRYDVKKAGGSSARDFPPTDASSATE
jgi:hypothetical protein